MINDQNFIYISLILQDEIEAWVIDALKAIGCDTAKSVLDISAEDLVSRTDLEIETVEDVLNILGSEFED